jgi:predicted MFS family arabinose efflux permease
MVALVMSTFMLFPYIAPYLVKNVGRTKEELPYVYFFGGIMTLLTLTPIGRLSDRFGKLLLFRVLALATAVSILLVTNLPVVSLATALGATTLLMVTASGRMVPGMALITASSVPSYRGSFLSVNSSVQQMAAGLAALIGGYLLVETDTGPLRGFSTVGLLGCVCTVVSVYLAGRLRSAEGGAESADPLEIGRGPESGTREPVVAGMTEAP